MRALVLSGGGNKGAFQAGAIDVLAAEETGGYDLFCGVSVGAINAAHLAQFHAFDEGSLSLLGLWEGLDTSQVHRRHFPFGYLSGLWKRGARNSQPLRDLMARRFSRDRVLDAGKRLSVGAVSLHDYQYRAFTERHSQIDRAVLASSAFPGMLPPVEIEGQLWVDGGVRNVTPLGDAIRFGATSIDVILCEAEWHESGDPPSNALGVGLRSFAIMMSEIVETDLKLAKAYNHLQGKRIVPIRTIRPAAPIGPANPLDFDPQAIQVMIEEGRVAVRKIIDG